MKRFTVITSLFCVSILAVWVFFDTFSGSSAEAQSANVPMKVHNETGEMLIDHQSKESTLPVMNADMKIAPVFNNTGAVVSDPTGTLLRVNHSGYLAVPVMGLDMKIAPVFDTTGAVVSDPTGTLLSSNHSGNDTSSDEFRYEDCTRIRSNRRNFARSGRYHILCDPNRR